MGQSPSHPHPEVIQESIPYVGLSKHDVATLWQMFTMISDGWAIDEEQVILILEHVSPSEDVAKTFFHALDTDHNLLIDGLEFVSTIVMMSAMDVMEKLFFVFSVYDFESTGELSYDQLLLLFAGIMEGLAKLSPIHLPRGGYPWIQFKQLEDLCGSLLAAVGRSTISGSLRIEEFKDTVLAHPILFTWLATLMSLDSKTVVTTDSVPDAETTFISGTTSENKIEAKTSSTQTNKTQSSSKSVEKSSHKYYSSSSSSESLIQELVYETRRMNPKYLANTRFFSARHLAMLLVERFQVIETLTLGGNMIANNDLDAIVGNARGGDLDADLKENGTFEPDNNAPWVKPIFSLCPKGVLSKRSIPSNDRFESEWIGGLNSYRIIPNRERKLRLQLLPDRNETMNPEGSLFEQMRRNVWFIHTNHTHTSSIPLHQGISASYSMLEDDHPGLQQHSSNPIGSSSNSSTQIMLYSSGSHVVLTWCDLTYVTPEWRQQQYCEHENVITAIHINQAFDLLITADTAKPVELPSSDKLHTKRYPPPTAESNSRAATAKSTAPITGMTAYQIFSSSSAGPLAAVQNAAVKSSLFPLSTELPSSRVVIWNLSTMTARQHWSVDSGVDILDISSNGRLFLTVHVDFYRTLRITDVNTLAPIFSFQLLRGNPFDRVMDARFLGSSMLFSVSMANSGIRVFIQEEATIFSTLRPYGEGLKPLMRVYEERPPLRYPPLPEKMFSNRRQSVTAITDVSGKNSGNNVQQNAATTIHLEANQVPWTSVTEICPLELPDEFATGTTTSHILVWRGRSVVQVLDTEMEAPVSALSFDRFSRTLAVGCTNGSIRLYTIRSADAMPGQVGIHHPRTPFVHDGTEIVGEMLSTYSECRWLEAACSFDILRHDLLGYSICALCLSVGGDRLLVSTLTCEMVEVTTRAMRLGGTGSILGSAIPATTNTSAIFRPLEGNLSMVMSDNGTEVSDDIPPVDILPPTTSSVVASGYLSRKLLKIGDSITSGVVIRSHFHTPRSAASKIAVVTNACKYGCTGFITCGIDGSVRIWDLRESDTAYYAKTLSTEVPESSWKDNSSFHKDDEDAMIGNTVFEKSDTNDDDNDGDSYASDEKQSKKDKFDLDSGFFHLVSYIQMDAPCSAVATTNDLLAVALHDGVTPPDANDLKKILSNSGANEKQNASTQDKIPGEGASDDDSDASGKDGFREEAHHPYGYKRNGEVHLFEVQTGQLITILPHKSTARVTEIRFTPSGDRIILSSEIGVLMVYRKRLVDGTWTFDGLIGHTDFLGGVNSGALNTKKKSKKKSTRRNMERHIYSGLDVSTCGTTVRTYCLYSERVYIYDLDNDFGRNLIDVLNEDNDLLNDLIGSENKEQSVYDRLVSLEWLTETAPYSWDTVGATALAFPSIGLSLSGTDLYTRRKTSSSVPDSATLKQQSALPSGTSKYLSAPCYTLYRSSIARSGGILATGLPSGEVDICHIPSLSWSTWRERVLTAHVGPVSVLLWFGNDQKENEKDENDSEPKSDKRTHKRLLTIGAQDGVLRVWRVKATDHNSLPSILDGTNVGGEEDDEFRMNIMKRESIPAAEGVQSIVGGALDEGGEESDDDDEWEEGLDENVDSGDDLDTNDNYRLNNTLLTTPGFLHTFDSLCRSGLQNGDVTTRRKRAPTEEEDKTETTTPTLAGMLAKSYVITDLLDHWASVLGYAEPSEALKLCLRALKTPPKPILGRLPAADLRLEWVYALSTRQTRQSVAYCGGGEGGGVYGGARGVYSTGKNSERYGGDRIVYPAGCVPVIYDPIAHTQAHGPVHSDEITALDVFPPFGWAVTAHRGAGDLYAHLWSTRIDHPTGGSTANNNEELNGGGGKLLLRVLVTTAALGISAIRFLPHGQAFITADQSTSHMIRIFSTIDGTLLSSVSGGSTKILSFVPSELPHWSYTPTSSLVEHSKVNFWSATGGGLDNPSFLGSPSPGSMESSTPPPWAGIGGIVPRPALSFAVLQCSIGRFSISYFSHGQTSLRVETSRLLMFQNEHVVINAAVAAPGPVTPYNISASYNSQEFWEDPFKSSNGSAPNMSKEEPVSEWSEDRFQWLLGLSTGSVALLTRGSGVNIEKYVKVFTNSRPITAMAISRTYVPPPSQSMTVKTSGTSSNKRKNKLHRLSTPVVSTAPQVSFRLIVAGAGGLIRTLDGGRLLPLHQFSLYSGIGGGAATRGLLISARSRGIKTLTVHPTQQRVLYATAGGEVGEFDVHSGVEIFPPLPHTDSEISAAILPGSNPTTPKVANQTPTPAEVLAAASHAGVRRPGRPLITGHFRESLTAMSASPTKPIAVTVGEDRTLRIWDLASKYQKEVIELSAKASAVALSPNGKYIAVALKHKSVEAEPNLLIYTSLIADRRRRQKEGLPEIPPTPTSAQNDVSTSEWSLSYQLTDVRERIGVLTFSGESNRLFAGSDDNGLYIFDTATFALAANLTGHTEPISKIDVSVGSRLVVSEGVSGEVLVWDTRSVTMISRAAERLEALAEAGLKWGVRQCLFGLNTFGIFSPNIPLTPQLTSNELQYSLSGGGVGGVGGNGSDIGGPCGLNGLLEAVFHAVDVIHTSASIAAVSHEQLNLSVTNLAQKLRTLRFGRLFGTTKGNVCGTGNAELKELRTLATSHSAGYFVVGDRYGGIHLYANPTECWQAPHKTFNAHGMSSSGVSGLSFAAKDSFLLSICADEKSMMQWRFLTPTTNNTSNSSSGNWLEHAEMVNYNLAGRPYPWSDGSLAVKRKTTASVKNVHSSADGFEGSFYVKGVDFRRDRILVNGISSAPPSRKLAPYCVAQLMDVVGVGYHTHIQRSTAHFAAITAEAKAAGAKESEIFISWKQQASISHVFSHFPSFPILHTTSPGGSSIGSCTIGDGTGAGGGAVWAAGKCLLSSSLSGHSGQRISCWNELSLLRYPEDRQKRPDVSSVAISPCQRFAIVGYCVLSDNDSLSGQITGEALLNRSKRMNKFANSDETSGIRGVHPIDAKFCRLPPIATPADIYATATGELIIRLSPHVIGGVKATAFVDSASEMTALVMSNDASQTLYAYRATSTDWRSAIALATVSTATLAIHSLVPLPPTCTSSDPPSNVGGSLPFNFVTAGEAPITFWRLPDSSHGGGITGEPGICHSSLYAESPVSTPFATSMNNSGSVPRPPDAGGYSAQATDVAEQIVAVAACYGPILQGTSIVSADIAGRVILWQGRHASLLVESHASTITSLVSFGALGHRRAGFVVASRSTISIWLTGVIASDTGSRYRSDGTANNGVVSLLTRLSMEDLTTKLPTFASLIRQYDAPPNELTINSNLDFGGVTLKSDGTPTLRGVSPLPIVLPTELTIKKASGATQNESLALPQRVFNGGNLSHSAMITSLAVDRQGREVRFSLSSGLTVQWLVDMDRLLVPPHQIGHGIVQSSAGLVAMEAHPQDSSLLMTLAEDGVVRMWNISHSSVREELPSSSSTGVGVSDMNSQPYVAPLAGILVLDKPVTAAKFLPNGILLLAIAASDSDGVSSAILFVRVSTIPPEHRLPSSTSTVDHIIYTRFEIIARLHNITRQAIRCFALSPNHNHLLAAAADGTMHLFATTFTDPIFEQYRSIPVVLSTSADSTNEQEIEHALSSDGVPNIPLTGEVTVIEDWAVVQSCGLLVAHASATVITGIDFSTCGRYVRTFGEVPVSPTPSSDSIRNSGNYNSSAGSFIEVSFFDINAKSATRGGPNVGSIAPSPIGAKIMDAASLRRLITVDWASTSSPAAAEACGVSFQAYPPKSHHQRNSAGEDNSSNEWVSHSAIKRDLMYDSDSDTDIPASSNILSLDGQSTPQITYDVLPARHLSSSNDGTLLAVGYDNGTVRIFHAPVYHQDASLQPESFFVLPFHATGAVNVAFLGKLLPTTEKAMIKGQAAVEPKCYHLATYGVTDNTLMLWNLYVDFSQQSN